MFDAIVSGWNRVEIFKISGGDLGTDKVGVNGRRRFGN